MKAILGVDGNRYGAYFVYRCPTCGNNLEKEWDKEIPLLKHPTHDGIIFKGKPIGCVNDGKVYSYPIQTIEVTEHTP